MSAFNRVLQLSDLIQEKLTLLPPSSTGFCGIRCEVCNDYKVRGGFKFDGGSTGFSCFNCHAAFKYEEGSGKFSKNAREVLRAFGITREDLLNISNSVFFNKTEESGEISLASLTEVNTTTPEVEPPPKWHPIGTDSHFELQIPLVEYLESRAIDVERHKFFFSLDSKFINRVIIPYYRNDKLIFWQARSILKDEPRRYLNCPASKEAVLFGFDQLFNGWVTPLFITEGVFDALSINGASILGSSLNDSKIEILTKSRRRKIFVIDRDHAGGDLAKHVLDLGWEITFADVQSKDINDSVVKFGKLHTAYTLMKNITGKSKSRDGILDLGLGLLEAKLRNLQ